METHRRDNDYNDYIVRVDLPGVDPNDVHVQAAENLLTITGERKDEEKRPQYRETFYGKFERQLRLMCTDEHEHFEVIVIQLSERLRLNTFEVDEDVVGSHDVIS
jgi:HSP20 family molecular chaperone IbpA